MLTVSAVRVDRFGIVPDRLQQGIVVYVLQKLVDLRFGIADFRTFPEKLGQRIFQFCYFVQGKSLQSF